MSKLMNSALVFVMLCGGFHYSHGGKLKCSYFKIENYYPVGTLYSCYVTSLDNSYNTMTIDGYTATHLANKYDKDINAIYMLGTKTKYIPEGLGSLSKLLALVLQSSNLVEIKAENFLGMENLEYLGLWSNKITYIPSDAFSSLKKLKVIYLYSNKIKNIGSGAFDQQTNLINVYLSDNVCVKKDYSGTEAISQMKEDIKVKCYNPNDPHEIIYKLKQEIRTLIEEKDALVKESNKITDLNFKLLNCEANQQKSMEFNLICDFKKDNGQYTCETRDLTIHHKDMKLNEVIGTHLKSKSNEEVTELIIMKSSMFYWSKDIFTKFPALQTLRIQNAQLNEFKKGDFNTATELIILVVNGNNIKHLGDDVFHGTKEHLTEINLNSNQIEKISAGTFHGLKQLKVLSLKENLITEIPQGSFKDIVMLEILILTGNKIKFLDGKMLEFNKRLMTLAVDQNELREIGEEILNHSKMLKDVNFGGNDCIDERTGADDDDTDGRTLNDLIFVIRNCCKEPAEALNVYNCGKSG